MADKNLTALTETTSLDASDLLYTVDGGNSRKVQLANLLKFSDRLVFFPTDNEPPTTNFATFDTRNNHPVLDFDDTTGEAAIFTGRMMRGYNGGGLTVEVGHSATTATTGTIGWLIAFERIGDSQQDVDSDGFASNQTITAATVPGTSGHVDVVSTTVTNGANMDSIAAGEQFRIRVTRDVANDTATGDAELHFVSIRET
jgi:hypothetical protein